MGELPAGTITFLVTDIENSTGHWEIDPDGMRAALAFHDSMVRRVIDDHNGNFVKHSGDGCWAAFLVAAHAADAAIQIQHEVQNEPPEVRERLKVRIGLHTGEAAPTGAHYFGTVPNRMARISDLANGDQIVCSSATASLLPSSYNVRSAGIHELRGIGIDEVHLLTDDRFESDVRPLRRPVLPTNLPRIRTSFLGREREVEQLVSHVGADHSVVTLLGPGGIGKTRLAIHVATLVSQSTAKSVVFCDLTAVREADDVASVVADCIGARQQPGMTLAESILDYIEERDVLIILDNCEQVLGAVRELVSLLSVADHVAIVATSRSALHLQGEQILDVPPLDATASGVELFISRASEHDSRFSVADGEIEIIGEVVKRLDGIPLAIELAAARVRLMSPRELLTRLDSTFDILSSSRQEGRHETLRDTVKWSYDLLTEAEAAVFDRLSVFAGGASLDDIASICVDGELVTENNVLDIVLSLTDQSMLVGRTIEGFRRFEMFETMRGFGTERLRDAGHHEPYQKRHASHFAHLASQQSERIFSAAEHDAWRVLDAEWANLRVALEVLMRTGDLDCAAGLVGDLVYYATFAMRLELFVWAEELLALDAIAEHRSLGDLCGAAALGAYLTVSGRTEEFAERGIAADPPDPQGWCRVALASVFLNNLHAADASDEMTKSWVASEPATIGGQLWSHGFRAFHLCTHGMPAEAQPHVEAMHKLVTSTGSISAAALDAWAAGMVSSFGDLKGAIATWQDAREGPRSMPRDHLLEHLLVGLILHFTVHLRDVPEALENCRSALQSALDSHYYAGTSHLFGVTAIALCRGDNPQAGATLLGAMTGNGHLPRQNALDAVADALGADAATFEATGRALSITQAGHLALDALDTALAEQVSEVGAV